MAFWRKRTEVASNIDQYKKEKAEINNKRKNIKDDAADIKNCQRWKIDANKFEIMLNEQISTKCNLAKLINLAKLTQKEKAFLLIP